MCLGFSPMLRGLNSFPGILPSIPKTAIPKILRSNRNNIPKLRNIPLFKKHPQKFSQPISVCSPPFFHWKTKFQRHPDSFPLSPASIPFSLMFNLPHLDDLHPNFPVLSFPSQVFVPRASLTSIFPNLMIFIHHRLGEELAGAQFGKINRDHFQDNPTEHMEFNVPF